MELFRSIVLEMNTIQSITSCNIPPGRVIYIDLRKRTVLVFSPGHSETLEMCTSKHKAL
jgi:hypothetical protein